MKELKCPKCGNVFTVDEADYASIVSQVKNEQFEAELKKRMQDVDALYKEKMKVEEAKAEAEFSDKIREKEDQLKQQELALVGLQKELADIEAKKEAEMREALAKKELEVKELQGRIDNNTAFTENEILKVRENLNKQLQEKELLIAELEKQQELSFKEAELEKNALVQEHNAKVKELEFQVSHYKDLKARMSTKMVGETLEEHCRVSYETTLRALMPTALFEKDNDASGGTKGDFVFRDFDNGLEYVSIMFEMKNEMDETDKKQKHKNEQFFKKLDADRKAKGCEYAVLVSLLESDSELYNSGIVDVSHHFPKMYVIRPQFFIPIITLLVNTSKKSIEYKRELVEAKNRSVDINNFQSRLEDFKRVFSGHYKDASNRFQEAVKGIDKTIGELEKIKKALLLSEDHLRLANKNAEDLNLKQLTVDSPGLRAQWEELQKQ